MKEKLPTVKAAVTEVFVEPDYRATVACPYCGTLNSDEVYEENYTTTIRCRKCSKEFKMKVPKYYYPSPQH